MISTASQPKSVAAGPDGTCHVAGVQTVEVFKSGQKVHEMKPAFIPCSIAAEGHQVAVGAEVCTDLSSQSPCTEEPSGQRRIPLQLGWPNSPGVREA
jgi:hypothetical protein